MRVIRFLSILIFILFMGCQSVSSKLTLNIWHQMLYENRKALRAVCDRYEADNPNIQINLTYRETEELRSNFQSSAMGGSGPELIYGPSDQVGPFSTMGIIQPLDNLFDADYFDKFVNNAIIKSDGSIWMIGDVVGNHLMLLYNKELLNSPPVNTDELIDIGKRLTIDKNGDGRPDQFGLVWNFTEPFFYAPWLAGFGEWLITDDNRPNLNTQANITGFQFIKSLRDKHKILPKECDYETANALFKTGSAAMIINGDWSWGDYKGIVDFGIARIPKVVETGKWPAPMVSTKGYSINVNTGGIELDETIKLVKYLTSDEVQLYYTDKLNTQPSSKAALLDPLVTENELLRDSAKIIEVGRPMPIVPEMRAIWDALRTQYQAVLGGNVTPEDAAKLSQMNAEKQIEEMNLIIQPTYQATIIKILAPLVFLLIMWFSKKHFTQFFQQFQKNRFAYYMIIPSVFGIFAVVIFPFFYNIFISLSNFSLRTFRDWQLVGFHNYISVFKEPLFYWVFIKTVVWTSVNLIFHVTLGVFLALLINRTMPAKPILRTMLIIPWALPQYISALTWRGMFNQEYGSINLLLNKFFAMDPIQWLSQPFEAFTACIMTNIWLGFPFMMVIALGGLQSIPREMYEAARVDGANSWQQFVKITLPMLKPVMIPAIILGTIWTFNNINVVWLVSNAGEPSDQTHILVSYVYKAAFNLYRYGYAAAMSMLIFLILLTFGLVFMKKTDATGSNVY
jgi:arabinogalactan oligomer / maltooligosaccharide transport system permease protein